jgi:primosomal replication protein N
MNRLVLRATLVERGALRYTPAGLPALDMVLKHLSELPEAGAPRKVSIEMRAVAIGEVARRAAALAVGEEADFDGFVAAQRNGRGVVFHLSELHSTRH